MRWNEPPRSPFLRGILGVGAVLVVKCRQFRSVSSTSQFGQFLKMCLGGWDTSMFVADPAAGENMCRRNDCENTVLRCCSCNLPSRTSYVESSNMNS